MNHHLYFVSSQRVYNDIYTTLDNFYMYNIILESYRLHLYYMNAASVFEKPDLIALVSLAPMLKFTLFCCVSDS